MSDTPQPLNRRQLGSFCPDEQSIRAFENLFNAVGVIDTRPHNELDGLQGGQPGEYFHLTNSEYTGTGDSIFVRQINPVLIAPDLGIPSAIDLSNATNLPVTAITGADDLTRVNDTNVTLTLNGTPVGALINPVELALGWAGQLSEARGGTNQSTYSLGDTLYASAANTLAKLPGNTSTTRKFLLQTGTGSTSAAPVWDTILAADIPASAITKTDDTNVTLTLGGSPATALLSATSLTLGWSGELSGARGGTGVANTGKTITLDGNLTTSGAYPLTLTLTGLTNVTLPTSGTLATTGGTVASITGTVNQVLANGTSGSAQIGAVILTLPQDINTSSNVQFSNITSSSLITSGKAAVGRPLDATWALAVQGRFSQKFYDSSGNGRWQTVLQNTGSVDLSFEESGIASNRFVLNAGGKISINTAIAASTLHVYENTSNTGTAIGLTIEQAGAGDAAIQFIADSTRVMMGIDNSDANKFKATFSTDLGTSPFFTVTTAGVFNIPNLTASKPIFTDTSNNLVSTGTVPVNQGGTGQTTYTNGQLLIGNTADGALTKSTLTGTSNQVLVTNGTGSITLSTPQDIATGSSPTFSGLLLSNTYPLLSISRTDTVTSGAYLQYKNNTTSLWQVGLFPSSGDSYYIKDAVNGNIVFSTSPGATASSSIYGNLTIGTITSGTWNGSVISEAYGGTNQSSYTLGNILYASASNTLSKLSGNTTTTKQYLSQTGTGTVSSAPSWATISQADISGLKSTDSPTFVGLTLSGLNINNVVITDGSKNLSSVNIASISNIGITGTADQIYVNGFSGSSILGAVVLTLPQNINTTSSPTFSAVSATTFTGSLAGNSLTATTLQTARAIYGNNFNGSSNLTQIINSTYGGTGNGFTKFSGAATTEKTFTLPNANCTILTDNSAITVAQGGTGQTSYTNGQLLIGNSTGNTLNKTTLTGTLNQITVTNGAGSVTLSTPQDIATNSAVQFSRIGIGTAATSIYGIDLVSPDAASNGLIKFYTNAGSQKWHTKLQGTGNSDFGFTESGVADNRLVLAAGGNISINSAGSFGGGTGVIFIANRSAVPSSNPSGGGILYTESGALKYRGSSGTVTTIANA